MSNVSYIDQLSDHKPARQEFTDDALDLHVPMLTRMRFAMWRRWENG